MIVIDKKRISFIIICLLLGLFAYSYQSTKTTLDYSMEEVSTTPVSGKTVVLDAGHGTPDERSWLLTLIK